MASKTRWFKSRVGYRLIVLLLVSSLVPIILLAIPSFNYVAAKLYQQRQAELINASQNIGKSIDQNIQHITTEMMIIADTFNIQKVDNFKISSISINNRLGEWFEGISIIRPSHQPILIVGSSYDAPILTTSEIDVLRQGLPYLKMVNRPKFKSDIYMFQLIDPTLPDRGVVVGHINAYHLWKALAKLPTRTIGCVLDRQDFPLYCTQPIAEFNIQKMASEFHQSPEGQFHSKVMNEEYLHTYWSNFNINADLIPQWTIFLSSPVALALLPIKNFTLIFPIVLIFSTLIILLLSISQIRRILIPLDRLREGTRYIANQNFHMQVNVDSGDEFEELAKSFNQMSMRLGKQFNTLETMSRIDRMILSTLDMDNIVETILIRMVHAVPCDSISLIIKSDAKSDNGTIYFRPDLLSTEISSSPTSFTEDDLELLGLNRKTLTIDNNGFIPGYLSPIKNLYSQFLILPIFLVDDLSGLIILCYQNKLNCTQDDLRQARDLTDRVAVALSNAAWEDKLYTQAHYDPLTKLPNRLLFQDRIHHAIKRSNREKTLVALMFLDLDHFKALNDTLGHAAGDEFLKEIANRISGCVRSIDTVARLGGDEFTIIIPDIHDADEAITDISLIASKIIDEAAKTYIIKDQDINLSVSVGIAIYPHDSDNFADLLKAADSALYYAKGQGKSNYQFYSEEIHAEAKKIIVLENKLKKALQFHEFELYYQPKYDTEKNLIIGAEALLRWKQPRSEMIGPDQFIPIAEESGLIIPIGEWALRTACQTCQDWHNQGFKHLSVSVNLSALQFNDEKITDVVQDILEETGLPAKCLELEITESTLMSSVEKTLETLQKFNEMGVLLSIDDFGTGYSSLSYLKKFPIQVLKIDQSFIKGIENDADNAVIASAIINLAQQLHLGIIAEGVETKEALDFLRSKNCHIIQGYYYSKPLTNAKFLDLIKKAVPNSHFDVNS